MTLRDRLFVLCERLDNALHDRGMTWSWLCRFVGRMEPGFYERTTDWDNPLYVQGREPELFALHRASLCDHGYRRGCPNGCPEVTS